MNANTKFMYLMAVVMGILVIASIIGAILHTRVKSESGRAVVLNLNARIRAWWGMIAIFAVAFWLGTIATLVLFAIVSFFALREFVTLTPTRPGDHRALAVAFFVMIPLQYYTIGISYYSLFSLMIPVYGFLLLPSLSTLTQDTEHFLERSAKIQWAVMITIYCISSAPALLMLKIPGYEEQSALLLFYLLLIVQLSDVMQYVVGKLFGKTKLAPVISPSKTVEGLIGGGAIAVAVGASLWWITPFSPLVAACMSAAIVAAGALGGLVLSAVKRSLGAKDWGTMIEGHGGTLDRMDSVSFAAPVFFHLVRYFYT